MTTTAVYELLEEIGKGSCATVYRTYDMALKRNVAIKELLPHLHDDPSCKRRLLEGARFLAGLSHDNIVPVYGLDEERGWIIMELMQGGLDSRLVEGSLSPDLTRSVLRQALCGLQFLHRQGKLHGAIKPANLLINVEGRIKLSDAAGLDAQGEVRKPRDNAKYLAPELINPTFGTVGSNSDLYSLGFTALELIKGATFDALFQGAGAADPQMLWLRLHGSPSEKIPSLRELVPSAPADLTRVIDRLLAKNVSERYANAAEVLQDLDEGELLPMSVPAVPKTTTPKPVTPTIAIPKTAAPKPQLPQSIASPSRQISPTSKSAQPPPGVKPWSREWINYKLSDRRILYPLLGTIIVGTLVFLFWPELKSNPTEIAQARLNSSTQDTPKEDRQSKEPHQTEKKPTTPPAKTNNYPPKKTEAPPVPEPSPPVPPKRVANSIDMPFAFIPAGKFTMGSSAAEADAVENEEPRHEVILTQPFYMGIFEVTQEQYEKVMGTNPAFFTQAKGGGPRHPVENVSWNDAADFCRQLSNLPQEKMAGRSYRLPTEAEWEYACRAGTRTSYSYGDALSAKDACFQSSNPGGDGGKGEDAERTKPVGSFAANAWGLYDMHGNVREWCRDHYSFNYYLDSPNQDPQGPEQGSEKVVRGGSWQSPGRDCRSACRMKVAGDLLNVALGFRVVMVPSAAGQ